MIMKKTLFILSLILVKNSYAIVFPGMPVVDVGAVTELISSTANQAVMIDNQYQMLKGLTQGDIHVSDFTDNLNKLKNISDSGLAVSYSTKDLESKFNKVFGDDDDDDSSAKKQKKQNQSMLDSALNTFKSASEQLSYAQQQASAVATITTASNNSSGVLAVAQGTNQLINSTNSQLQSITAMEAQQNSLLATKMAQKAAANKAVDKQRAITFAFTDIYHPYEDNPDFAGIPTFNAGT